ncbi:MAG: class I SAM-dependent rRNA methyltransferase [Chlorobium sp.]|jgi:23S rRNA (cytosine1962-C5)-methyltransferase|uniref:class I SAM-dependent rRNA methyltransferase n=1 Tax=Chlorobium sp. TaxID=1095 RepID=UPI001D9BE3C7|nr:class I SAM-dependent rRNA methyltransferase [Chlorobium sp.]MBN1278455.1 class I SAM-dependent rRNA methyltransferase [Chlorobiaceae bacterium]MCF8215843.1 class I SAM-dependent rRNA methyltransferase [Chlorobium sp.]MCF8270741.1 class I SAM-dependent rRNA methyltransferase [Chlorobium sp.]MCF8287053.1 class I SAM-dependent rRNA methyltransferase [Chlorobium sp.]MCF8290710.1 class I SAM-dependent rRNA methyltransferase [Chlorobium sp.]
MHDIRLKPKEQRRLLKGHLWVFSNELQTVPKDIAAGETVQLLTHDNKLLGTGFYNPHSLIAFRLLSRSGELPDKAFFRKKIAEALRLREAIYSLDDSNAWRLVHGESDGLPGLIIDRFNRVIVLQAFSAGMDRHLPLISEVIDELLKPEAIVIRNESQLRELEGLPLYKDIVKGERSSTCQTIHDAGISYEVDLHEGQKTGFFLDQRENRRFIRSFSKGADVLDVFTNDGGFALNALHGGARSAIMVDISEETLKRAEKNALLNGFENFSLITGDAFSLLSTMTEAKERFDVVILDPPSFTKSRKNLPAALKAYKKLNKLGLQLVKPGGFLATASCSHHVSEEDFLETIHQAALSAGRQLRMIHKNSQPPDHPVLLSMPETGYLKFACFYVTDNC